MCSVCCTCLRIVVILIASLGVIAIILGAVLGFAVLPDMIEREIIKRVRLENGTDQFDRWVELPFPITFKVYFFNLTNPNEVLNTNATPVVEEIGPYIYKQTRKKRDIVSNQTADTLFYYQYMWFEFDTNASAPLSENDRIMTLNAPLMGLFQTVEIFGNLLLPTANAQWQAAFPGQSLFDEFRVGDYLFNGINFCQDTNLDVCSAMRQVVDTVKTLELQQDNSISFSFLSYKHDNNDGSYKITAGNDVIEDLGLIREWNGTNVLGDQVWGSDNNCSRITGRDSTIFPPFIEKDDEFDIFQTDICRVATLEYVRNQDFAGVSGQRRELKNDTLTNTGENSCFCSRVTRLPNGTANACWPDGFLDLYTCMGANVIMSYPHFLNADLDFVGVSGLNASHDAHVTFATLEPGTGTPLVAAKRMQFNIVIRPINFIEVTQNLPEAVFPLLWVEEGMELPQHLLDELDDEYLSQLVMVDAVTWTLISVGIVMFIAATLYLICCR